MLTFVDLFCGAGFGARGAVNAGGQPLLAVDAWDVAAHTYRENFPDSKVFCAPVEELNPKSLCRGLSPDVLLTSPECTSHSIARGAKPGTEASRETAISIVPWLGALKPRWLIVENVRRMKQWDRHNELVNTIEDAGYTVSDLYLNATDFGAPQSRKRMFLVCDQEGTTVTEDHVRGYSKKSRKKNAKSILSPDRRFTFSPLYKKGRAKATIERAERAIAELGPGVGFIIVYYGSDYAGGWQKLDAPLRTVTTLDRFALVRWVNDVPHMRMLQPEELLRAMGAPEHTLGQGTRRDRIKLCGNGVCSPVVEAIWREISARTLEQQLLKAC